MELSARRLARFAFAVLLVPLLAQAAASKPIPWAQSGTFVPERVLYQLRCAQTAGDICAVYGDSGVPRIVFDKGRIHFRDDTECGQMVLTADSAAADSAEGVVDPEGSSIGATPVDRRRYVQIWRENDSLVIRGPDRYGCEMPDRLTVNIERWVPRETVKEAAVKRATELGVKFDAETCVARGKLSPLYRPPAPCRDGVTMTTRSAKPPAPVK